MKHSRRLLSLLVILAASLSIVGCGSSAALKTSEVSGTLTRIVDRTDGYVNADATLADKTQALGDTTYLRTELTKASIPIEEIRAPFNRIADRHDGYTNADGTLTPLKKRVNLRDTALIRNLIASPNAPTTQP